MKKIYSLTTLSLAVTLLINSASAQTYTGGTYTAVRSKDWHVTSGINAWDPNGEPSADCKNCKIIINPGVTVNLNLHVVLEQSSTLIIGAANSTDAAILKVVGSGAGVTDFTSANNVIVLNDGINPVSNIVLASTTATLDGSGGTSDYDGIFTTFPSNPVNYYKKVGTGHAAFSGTTVADQGMVTTQTMSGVKTLSGDGALPVILSQFDAALDGKQVDLTWTTDQEVNSDHFAILHSADAGAHWQSLGTVAARGNSSTAAHYSFSDVNPAAGTNEYRLQSVDRDGASTYSEIRTVRNGLIGSVSIFPNPAKDYVNISLSGNDNATGNLSIRLISQAGQLLVEKKVNNTGGMTVSLPVSSYPQGNYLVQVIGADGSQQISKVFISRQ
ncbi:MAG TPA: T9SS type A sorting domain-containing protein [Puia sp.]|nr:T9SS type A sorting domain-containing protein [Puia sp.]